MKVIRLARPLSGRIVRGGAHAAAGMQSVRFTLVPWAGRPSLRSDPMQPARPPSRLRVTVGDLVRLPRLMKAPRPHCEQTKIRGSVADVAPTWPQFGQMIQVSMSVASARSRRAARAGAEFSAAEHTPSFQARQPPAAEPLRGLQRAADRR